MKKGKYNPSYQERYFVLTDGHLHYYTPDNSGQHYKGKVFIQQIILLLLFVAVADDVILG